MRAEIRWKNDEAFKPEHSWRQLSYGVDIQVSFLLIHKQDEEAHFLQYHEHHYAQETPVEEFKANDNVVAKEKY